MDLEELKFVVDTKELETAATRINELGTAVSKLNKPMQDLTKESAKTNKELSKAEEAAAKAALAQAKLEQAQNKTTQSAAKSSSVLERQNLILEFMAQGNSRGQASILATAKAAGALDDEMLQLNNTLKTQRTLIGGDPFDKSIGLMQKLQNEYKTTNEVTNLFNKNLGLTEKQMIDLAREKERLIALYGIEGRSLNGLAAEYEQLIQKSVKINQANDARTNSMKAQVKAQNDAAKANTYLITEIDRVNRLTESNGAITSTVNNKLIKFEQALKASGTTAADQVIALQKYKAALMSVQKAGGDRQVDYLSRALGPQITDIAVGLATGQAPLTILLQQGGQLRDQFALAGVAGAEMGKMLVQASKAMIVSIKDIGLAVGQLVTGALAGTGKAITNAFIAPFERASEVREAQKKLDDGMISNLRYARLTEVANGRMIQSFLSLGKVIGGVVLVAVGLLAKGLFDVIKQEDALTRQLVLTGASLGINTAQATSYANSMNAVGISTDSALKVISAMAKEGGFLASEIRMVVTAADNLKLAGVTIEDTVKQFSKLKEKPVEALIAIAKATGLVKPEIVALVSELEQQGKTSQAAAIAMKAYADVTIAQKDRLENELSGFAVFMKTLGTEISNFFDGAFRSLWRKSDPSEAIEKQIKQINDVLKGGIFVGGVSESALKKQRDALVEELMRLDDLKVAELSRNNDNIRTSEALGEWQKLSIANLDKEKKAELDIANIRKVGLQAKKSEAEIEKLIAAYREKNKPAKTPPPKVEPVFAPASRDLSIIQKDYNEQLRLAEGFARDERSILKARFDAGLIDRADFVSQDTQLLIRAEQKQLGVIDEFAEKYRTAYEAQANLLSETLGKTTDSENRKRLENDIRNLVKDFLEFNATLDDTRTKIGSAFGAREQIAILEFQKATKASTDALRQYIKTQEDTATNRQIDIDLQDRLTNAYGAEAVKIKAVADETKRQTVEISKFVMAQQLAFAAYQKTLNDPNASGSIRAEAYRAYITAMDNANTAISTSRVTIEKAGTDAVVSYYKDEYQRVSNDIADAIVTALFEGGKAGSKKLRNLIVAELRKPITIVVKALVDATLGSFIQSAIGGSAGSSFAGSATGSAATGGLSGLTIGGSTIGSLGTSFGQGMASGFGYGGNAIASIEAGSANATAFNAGGYAAPVLGAAAGIYGGRAVSGGYSAMGGTSGNSAVNTGTAIGMAIAGPLGAALGGLAGGAFNRTFGRKLTDVGIRGTLGGETGFQGERYTFEKGGLLRSNKTSTSLLEEADRSAIASDFRLIKGSVMDLAESAGFGSNAIEDFTAKFQINLKGLSPEEATKKYQEEFAKIEESMAKAVIGTSGYRRENETSIQALTRISSFMGGVNSAFEKLGFQTYKLEIASLDTAQAFVDLFGGIDGFNKAMSFFYENFFTQQEKTANLTKDLTKAFGDLGTELPTTREAFRALVVAAKEAGNDTQVKNLLDLQYAFAELVPVTEEVVGVLTETMKQLLKERADLEVELLQVQGKTDEANAALRRIATEGFTEAELAAYDYNDTLKAQIQGYKDAKIAAEEYRKSISESTDNAYKVLEASVNAEKAAIDVVIDSKNKTISALKTRESKVRDSISVLNTLFDTLDKNIKELYAQAGKSDFNAARKFITDSLSTAKKTGILPDNEKLSSSIDTVRNQLDKNQYASKVDAERDRLGLVIELEALQALTVKQLTSEEKMLAKIEKQIESLESQIEILEASKVLLDGILTDAKLQIEVMRELNVSVISVESAIAGLASAIRAETALRAAEQVTAIAAVNTGLGEDIVARANGGYTSPGLALVGEKGPELVNFNSPGMVYSAAQTSSLLSGNSSEELAAIREELIMLRAETRAVVSNTSKTSRLLDRASPDGQSLQVTVLA
jgi:hypothetical protein